MIECHITNVRKILRIGLFILMLLPAEHLCNGKKPPLIAAPESGRWPPEIINRRACFQQELRNALAYDLNPNYFMMGCDKEPLWGFEEWAERINCGVERLDEKLLIHTAWTGPIDATLAGKQSVRRDLEALFDSFLMTQDTSRSTFIMWWMDRDPDPTDPLEVRYRQRGIEFRRPDFYALAKGTPLEGHTEILSMGDNLVVSKNSKRPRQTANMFRTLALHVFGGVWVDTDTLILRDLRPIFEYAGEFATQVAMSKYYNNNFMGLR